MKLGLIILPFLALFIAVLGSAITATNPTFSWVVYAGWGLALALIGLWVALDLEAFKRFFTRKGARFGLSSSLNVVLVVAAVVGVGFLSTKPRFNKSVDVSKAQVNTLSDQSVKVVRNLQEKNIQVEVTAFFDDQAQQQKFDDLLDKYQRVAEVFKVSNFNPRMDNTKAQSLNLTSANTVIFNAASRESRITEFTEEKVTNALVNVMKDKAKKVYFTAGHGEPAVRGKEAKGYDLVIQELESNRYEVADLQLLQNNSIPTDADLVVIAGAVYDFTENEVGLIEAYVKKGGALLLALDAIVPTPNLAALAAKFGVNVSDDLLILPPNDPRARFFGQGTIMVSKFDETSPVTRDFATQSQVTMLVQNARSLTTNETNALSLKPTLIGKTAEGIVRVKDVKTESDLQSLKKGQIENGEFGVFAVAIGKSSADVAANATKDDAKKDVDSGKIEGSAAKEIRVVIAGSSKFANNQAAQNGANRDMFVNMTNFLLQDEDFISIRPREAGKGTIEVSSGRSQLALVFISYLYPFLFLFAGIIYWWRRRDA